MRINQMAGIMVTTSRWIFLIFIISVLWGQSADAQNKKRTFFMDSTGFQIRVLPNEVFGIGERFEYHIYYGVIPAGKAGIEIMPELVQHRQAPCYDIHTWAYTAKAIDLFFKVRDEIHSYMDTRGIFTWYFEKQLNEGKYHDVKVVDYDQRSGTAYTTDDGVPSDTSRIPLFVQDAISALFYFRLQPIEVGKSKHIFIHDIKKTYPMRIDILAREEVDVPAGKFTCFKVEPVLESAGIFKSKGRIFIWFTDDERRLPVMLKSKVLIGSFAAYLDSYAPGMVSEGE
ncbi:hypothetical protein CEE37_04055 [candidate division LCP-89 bacterium B3_LCP]|uniref:DUF3108 domain-containing protein n=1 Tax=candidate division LCP-89 bacterium B3_LCP TaxID=2012998 RepID=A0A532V3F5_UNCL8|nr:MAG: hypothetical protein CEE37_04055 [candidate division LCP-89 bacterium B3_LCP]